MRLLATLAVIFATAIAIGPAAAAHAPLRASPPQVTFGSRDVGTFTLRGTTITNRGSTPVLLLVSGERMPDDFSFGLLEGSTCPVLAPGVLEPGESCVAVVGFRPSEFFAGSRQLAQLRATATDPATGETVASIVIDFTGQGRSSTA